MCGDVELVAYLADAPGNVNLSWNSASSAGGVALTLFYPLLPYIVQTLNALSICCPLLPYIVQLLLKRYANCADYINCPSDSISFMLLLAPLVAFTVSL